MSTGLRVGVVVVLALAGVTLRTRADDALQRLGEWCGRAAEHRGVPAAVGRAQDRGTYTVSLWAAPEVGIGLLYVVVVPREGVPFVPPRDVRILLQSASGESPAQQYRTYPERVRHGARFVTKVALPRVDRWRARVVIDGVSGADDLRATFASVAPSATGPTTLLLSATPFALVAGLWGPWRRTRRRRAAISARPTPGRIT